MTETVSFGEIFELERHPVEIDLSEKYTQIGIRSYGNGIFHRPTVTGNELSKLKYFHVYPDRIIFSNIMAWEGAVALSGPDEDGTVGSQRFLSYRPTTDKVDLRYINYFFQSERGVELIRDGSTGSVKRNQTLSPKTIERFDIPLPDLAEQRRIGQAIDRFLSKLCQLSNASKFRVSREDDLRSSILNEAFPETAPNCLSVSEFAEVQRGRGPKYAPGSGVMAINQACVRWYGLDMSRAREVDSNWAENLPDRFIAKKSSILVNSTGEGTIGRACIVDETRAGNPFDSHVLAVHVNQDIVLPEYFALAMRAPRTQKAIEEIKSANTTKQTELGKKNLESIEVPVPQTLEHQRETVERVRSLFARTEHVSLLRGQADGIVNALPPAVLNAAFSGQL